MTSARFQSAVTLAGVLAEHGVVAVELHTSGSVSGAGVVHHARACDLPGIVVAAPEGSILLVPTLGLEVRIGREGLGVVAGDSDDARAIARAIARALAAVLPG